MDPSKQLEQAARQISRLIEAAAGPARQDAAALSSEAPAARERRKAARASVKAAGGGSFLGRGIPFFGRSLQKSREDAASGLDAADADWTDVMTRARGAAELLKDAQKAETACRAAGGRARRGGPMPPGLAVRINDLWLRAEFLAASQGSDMERADRLGRNAFALAREAGSLARLWDSPAEVGASRPAGPDQRRAAKPAPANVPAKILPGRRVQMALDFDGTGQTEEEPRIWLPVSTTRTRELVALGARLEKGGPRRGSKLFIPVSERAKLDSYLPLAFRRQATRFSFPPIRHNAVGQNLWSVFDTSSWNHIRTTAYDRAGHRCQICGQQGGGLWARLATKEEKARGRSVECHEVWEWQVAPGTPAAGIQKLVRLLIVCSDCHLLFHDRFALSKARSIGIEAEAADYIKARRMLLNRCDGETLDAQLAADGAAWEANLSVRRWVLDLSHLGVQDFMADHIMVLKEGNKAGVGPAEIGGIAFRTESGTSYPPARAAALAGGAVPQPLSRQR